MAAGLLGQKKEMTQVFDDAGRCIPVTVVKAGPCVVVQIKTKETDGYNAVQLGWDEVKEKKIKRPQQGQFTKNKLKFHRYLREFYSQDVGHYKVGQNISAEIFRVGDVVNVRGVSKGKGFQGVIKRHGKHGGPASHGSHLHRSTGAIGQCQDPGRVFKNMKLPGQMGSKRVTIRNLEVVVVKTEDNLIYLKGSVPGAKNGLLVIENCDPEFETRLAKPEKTPEVVKVEAAPPKEEKKEEKKEAVKAEAAPPKEDKEKDKKESPKAEAKEEKKEEKAK